MIYGTIFSPHLHISHPNPPSNFPYFAWPTPTGTFSRTYQEPSIPTSSSAAHQYSGIHQHTFSEGRGTMAQMTPAELEQLQDLSDRYQAELPGPLIGERLPMDVLVTEYAQADPTFVVKTTGLAATHSSYRAVKGDGQCGWRATVYSYFEKILLSGDITLVQQEKVRLQTFEDTMNMVGIEYENIVDLFDYTWELFDKIMQAVEHQNLSEHIVLEDMNDENKSNSIVYHFKMMTSAFMQLRADQYEPFLEMPIAEYRVARIDPSNQEIDQIGLQALTDAIISPAGFALEVLYLDRSYGEEVTPHMFSENMHAAPTIRLLYRPGHYDIIYRDNQPMTVFVQNQPMDSHNMEEAIHPNAASDTYAALFGVGSLPYRPSNDPHGSMGYDSTSHYQHQPSYYDYYSPPTIPYPEMPMQIHSPLTPQQNILPPTSAAHPSLVLPAQQQHRISRQSSLTNSSPSQSGNIPPSPPSIAQNQPQIRFTPRTFEMSQHEVVPFDSRVGSSTTSTAHFRNQDFTPQMWSPGDEHNNRP